MKHKSFKCTVCRLQLKVLGTTISCLEILVKHFISWWYIHFVITCLGLGLFQAILEEYYYFTALIVFLQDCIQIPTIQTEDMTGLTRLNWLWKCSTNLWKVGKLSAGSVNVYKGWVLVSNENVAVFPLMR